MTQRVFLCAASAADVCPHAPGPEDARRIRPGSGTRFRLGPGLLTRRPRIPWRLNHRLDALRLA
jgi:hypothetical protein